VLLPPFGSREVSSSWKGEEGDSFLPSVKVGPFFVGGGGRLSFDPLEIPPPQREEEIDFFFSLLPGLSPYWSKKKEFATASSFSLFTRPRFPSLSGFGTIAPSRSTSCPLLLHWCGFKPSPVIVFQRNKNRDPPFLSIRVSPVRSWKMRRKKRRISFLPTLQRKKSASFF